MILTFQTGSNMKSQTFLAYEKLFKKMGGAIAETPMRTFYPPEIYPHSRNVTATSQDLAAFAARTATQMAIEEQRAKTVDSILGRRPKVKLPRHGGIGGTSLFTRPYRNDKETAFMSKMYALSTCDSGCLLIINNHTGHACGMRHGETCKTARVE